MMRVQPGLGDLLEGKAKTVRKGFIGTDSWETKGEIVGNLPLPF